MSKKALSEAEIQKILFESSESSSGEEDIEDMCPGNISSESLHESDDNEGCTEYRKKYSRRKTFNNLEETLNIDLRVLTIYF